MHAKKLAQLTLSLCKKPQQSIVIKNKPSDSDGLLKGKGYLLLLEYYAKCSSYLYLRFLGVLVK